MGADRLCSPRLGRAPALARMRPTVSSKDFPRWRQVSGRLGFRGETHKIDQRLGQRSNILRIFKDLQKRRNFRQTLQGRRTTSQNWKPVCDGLNDRYSISFVKRREDDPSSCFDNPGIIRRRKIRQFLNSRAMRGLPYEFKVQKGVSFDRPHLRYY